MDKNIHNVIACNVETAELIIDGKCKITKNPCHESILEIWKEAACFTYHGGILEVVEIFYSRVVDNIEHIIKNEGNMEGIRIDEKTDSCNNQDMDERPTEKVVG
jgi:hypothetical protein